MTEPVLRPCVLADAAEVERLRVAGWRAAYRGIVPDEFLDRMPVDVDRRAATIGRRTGSAIEMVAEGPEGIVGWMAAGVCQDDDRTGTDDGEVYACYVLPGQWRRGSAAGSSGTRPWL